MSLTKDDLAALLTTFDVAPVDCLCVGKCDCHVRHAHSVLNILWPRIEQELKPKTCETCRHRRVRPHYADTCGRTVMSDGVHPTVTYVPCNFLGNGCRAHEPKP